MTANGYIVKDPPRGPDRCPSKKEAWWRCELRKGHDGRHQAPTGYGYVQWDSPRAHR